MKNVSLALTAAAICLGILQVPGQTAAAPASVAGDYKIVQSSRPGGGGGYTGKVSIGPQGAAYQVQWTLDSGESYSGPAILQNGVLGGGYGDGLAGVAVYEIKGRTLKAKWLLAAAPQTVGDYELSGPASLNGFFKFTNGVAGGVTIKPNGDAYDLLYSLPTGTYKGIAVKVGDVLVAVSGNPGATNYGVVAYHAAGGRVEGVWTMPGQKSLGAENLVPASSAAAPATADTAGTDAGGSATGFSAAGTDVQFAGETYHLQNSASAPGQATSELREYLRSGETFDNYSKMVALRLQGGAGTEPYTFTRVLLQQTKKDYPQAETHEIGHTGDFSAVEIVLTSGSTVEYNLWYYFRTSAGLASVQFVLRNQGLYDTKDKFKAERKAHFDAWLKDAKTLAPQVLEALSKTVKSAQTSAPSNAADAPEVAGKSGKQPDPADDALVGKIQVDLQTCAGIAGNFLSLLKASKFNEAAALVADEGLTQMKTNRKDFQAKLEQAQRTDGKLLSFAPDKTKTDFGAEAGGIYFVLAADGKNEKTTTSETLRFFRSSDGKVKMVGYRRASKTAP